MSGVALLPLVLCLVLAPSLFPPRVGRQPLRSPPALAWALPRTKAVRVRELTDATFEHDTQASTGQTTGRWLVLFLGEESQWDPSEFEGGPPRDQSSSEEEEVAEGVSRKLLGPELIHRAMEVASEQRYVIATVRVDQNPKTRKRFGVSSTPVLKLFRDRRVYTFPGSGAPETTADLRHFLEAGFASVRAEEVPPEPSWAQEQLENILKEYGRFKERLAGSPLLLGLVGITVSLVFFLAASSVLGVGKPQKTTPKAQTGARAGAKRD